MKLKHKATGQVYNITGSYADKDKGTLRVYLADEHNRPVTDALLDDIMQNYEALPSLWCYPSPYGVVYSWGSKS